MKIQHGILLCLSALACKGSENKISRLSQTDTFHQVPTNMVDVLWVVDNSHSMADEQEKIADRFGEFLSGLEEVGVDWHMGVISTDLDDVAQAGVLRGEPKVLSVDTPGYLDLFRERVQLGTEGSDKEKGIDAAFEALSFPLVVNVDANDGFRRAGAMLMINYFSDENDCSDRGGLIGVEGGQACYGQSDKLAPVAELIRDYRGLVDEGERLMVSAIVGPAIADGCEGSKPGTRYQTMAKAFGGVQGNICDTDFSEIMADLGLEAGGMSTSFILEHFAVEESIEVFVDEDTIGPSAEDGWTYDNEYHVIHFHGAGVPPRGSRIQVAYDVAKNDG
jgi:hypothetical protein